MMAEVAGQRKSWSPDLATAGLMCRGCGCRHFYVVCTRRAPGGRPIRQRECRHCGKRVTTREEAGG